MNTKPSGFTVIELMIVIAIIGILAATILPQFLRNAYMSKRTEVMIQLKEIHYSQMSHFQSTDTFAGFYVDLGLKDIQANLKFYSVPPPYVCNGAVIEMCIYYDATTNKPSGYASHLWGDIDNQDDGAPGPDGQEDVWVIAYSDGQAQAIPVVINEFSRPFIYHDDIRH